MSEERKLFGQPIRKGITDDFHPSKLTLDEFVEFVKSHVDGFKKNMDMYPKEPKFHDPKYVESWFEMFMAWSEVEQDR